MAAHPLSYRIAPEVHKLGNDDAKRIPFLVIYNDERLQSFKSCVIVSGFPETALDSRDREAGATRPPHKITTEFRRSISDLVHQGTNNHGRQLSST